jgi:hypothetical protein
MESELKNIYIKEIPTIWKENKLLFLYGIPAFIIIFPFVLFEDIINIMNNRRRYL